MECVPVLAVIALIWERTVSSLRQSTAAMSRGESSAANSAATRHSAAVRPNTLAKTGPIVDALRSMGLTCTIAPGDSGSSQVMKASRRQWWMCATHAGTPLISRRTNREVVLTCVSTDLTAVPKGARSAGNTGTNWSCRSISACCAGVAVRREQIEPFEDSTHIVRPTSCGVSSMLPAVIFCIASTLRRCGSSWRAVSISSTLYGPARMDRLTPRVIAPRALPPRYHTNECSMSNDCRM